MCGRSGRGRLARWALLALAGCAGAADGPAAAPRLATFECDATPPPGHPACGGWIRPLESVEAPLLLKGVILDDGSTRAVLAALDWCRLHGGAYDLFRRRIAEAAGVPETRVAVQCTHAHDAPRADTRAQELLDRVPQPPRHLDLAFMDEVTRRAARAVREARERLRPDAFVAVAANGEGGPGYICTDRAIAEGGYEPTMSLVGPPSEAIFKRAIADLVGRLDPSGNPR
jgi:hypothetical protein